MDNIPIYLLNIFINSFLAFFTSLFLIEIIIFLFRISQGRFASILRMIPILKLPLDMFMYDFSRWSYLHGINPLQCQEGTRMLSAMVGINSDYLLPVQCAIQFLLPGNLTFTIADVIGHYLSPIFLKVFCFGFVLYSVLLVLKKTLNYCSLSSRNDRELIRSQRIRNPILKKSLERTCSKIVLSSEQNGPYVTGLISCQIHMPTAFIETLSRREYEAVIAHEVEHVLHKDNLTKFILNMIASAFWWVPTRWLQKRIEEGREIGCDLKCYDYGINPLDLASAIYKYAKIKSMAAPSSAPIYHLAKHICCKRVHLLLRNSSKRFKNLRRISYCLAASVAICVVFFGRFWTF